VVAKRGYHDVTVELIVKRAHVSYKTFYKHFSEKNECFLTLFETSVRNTETIIRARLAAEQLPWPEQVALALRILFERIVEEPIIARAVIVEAPALGPAIAERYERATKAFVPLFRAGRQSPTCRADLPDTVEDTLSGAVFWSILQRLITARADSLPELLPELIELVLRTYIGPVEAGSVARAEPSLELD
jgi:AcrR family transcriptional regulator